MVPSSFAISTSREGSEASAATSFALITCPGIAPAVITNFSLPLAKSLRTFATATGSLPMPYASGPDILSASPANGVSATARRTRVFLTTLKYTPEARALARSFVMSATAMPRFSARTMACAPATCFATSATTASFC